MQESQSSSFNAVINPGVFVLQTDKMDKTFYSIGVRCAEDIQFYDPADMLSEQSIIFVERFNKSAVRLVTKICVMNEAAVNYAQMITSETEQQLREACRDVYSELDIYVEKMKAFCRFFFFLDLKKTDSGDKWGKAMIKFCDLPNGKGVLVKRFLDASTILLANHDYKFVQAMRNAEVHNESPIDAMQYDLELVEDNVSIKIVGPMVFAQTLYDKAMSVCQVLEPVARALQKIIDQISPIEVCDFVESRYDSLVDVYLPEERWKAYKEAFQRIQRLALQ